MELGSAAKWNKSELRIAGVEQREQGTENKRRPEMEGGLRPLWALPPPEVWT